MAYYEKHMARLDNLPDGLYKYWLRKKLNAHENRINQKFYKIESATPNLRRSKIR